jgi:hypothetical protein
MLFFPEEGHVHRWCEQWEQPRGYVLSLDQCLQLAQAWYRDDRRGATWRRKTAAEAEATFARIGLTGPFWRL